MRAPVAGGGLWVWYLDRPVGVLDLTTQWKHVPGTTPGRAPVGWWVARTSDAGVLGAAAQAGMTHVLVKAGDGVNVWPQFTRDLVDTAHNLGLKCVAWDYCYLDDPYSEAQVALHAFEAGADGLVLDVEYEAVNKFAAARHLVDSLRSGAPDQWIGYSPDLRIAFGNAWPRLGFNPDIEPWPWETFNELDGCLPQLYWTDFQTDPHQTVDMVDLWMQGCSGRGWRVPAVYPVLPGNSDSGSMVAACARATPEFGGASIWRWGSSFNGNMTAVGGSIWKIEDGDDTTPVPTPDPGTGSGGTPVTPGPDARRSAWVTAAESESGRPYVWAGKDHNTGYDCSGLLTDKARAAGFDLGDPYYTNANGLKAHGEIVANPMRGDYVLFVNTYFEPGVNPDTYATHCGIVVDPDAQIMVDTHGDPWPGVGHTFYGSAYWQQHFLAFYRPHDFNDNATEEEDPAVIAELQARVADLEWQVGYAQGTIHDAIDSALTNARAEPNRQKRDAHLQAAQDANATLGRLSDAHPEG